MRKLLVTGGAGFIGANFVRYWLNRRPNDTLVVLDVLTYAGNPANLAGLDASPGFRFVRGDICDRVLVDRLLAEYDIDTIVHFAAESHVDRSILEPDQFIRTNVTGTFTLLEAAKRHWSSGERWRAHRFHHVSTDEVYGSLEEGEPPFRETTAYAPNSPYSASKAGSDHLVRAYHRTYGLDATTSHCSNNYGPYQYPEKLIPLALINLLHGKPVPVYGDGRNIRDWLHVDDHCRGIERVLEAGQPGECYNIGGGQEWRNVDIVERIIRLLQEYLEADTTVSQRFPAARALRGRAPGELIEFVADRRGHDRRYAIDSGKIESSLGFRPAESFESGIRKTVRWYLDNPQWWTPLLG